MNRRRYKRSTLVLVMCLVISCVDEASTANNHRDRPNNMHPFPVSVDEGPYLNLTAEERKRIEEDVVTKIVSLSPAKDRELVAKMLRGDITPRDLGYSDTESSGQVLIGLPAGTADPETARLFGVLGSVRAANLKRQAASQTAVYESRQPQGTKVLLTIAFDNTKTDGTVVILRPDWGPAYGRLPILVLPRNATPADLRAGIRTAAKLYIDFGPAPTEEVRAEVVVTDADSATPQATRLLADVRTSPARNVLGVGLVPATEILTYYK